MSKIHVRRAHLQIVGYVGNGHRRDVRCQNWVFKFRQEYVTNYGAYAAEQLLHVVSDHLRAQDAVRMKWTNAVL